MLGAGRDTEQGLSMHLVEEQYQNSNELTFTNVAGVLLNSDRVRFERMLFRATRGNCYVRFADIEDSAAVGSTTVDKVVFIIFFKSQAIANKIKRICDAFSAHRYDVQSLDRRADLLAQEQANFREMTDAKTVLDKNRETRMRLCSEVAQIIEEWLWIVRREKGVYHTLNLFKNDVAGNLLRARGWIITSTMDKARAALNRAHSSLNLPPTAMLERVPEIWPEPPTHFNTNKYTDAFQEFVNTYGVPRYREANPSLFTAASFPFLFGIMYGDIGHGSCLFIFGLILILTESKAEARGTGEMLKGIYSARYMIAAMGLCAMYAGSIYNDFFSLGLDWFGSRYNYVDQTQGADAEGTSYYGDASNVYPYGVDPAWKISDNKLLFFNSMKMKLAVILGITQMTFGICLKGINAIYFRSWLDFFCEFVPMILFDLAFFGYMVICIFVKWSIDWNHRMGLATCGYGAGGASQSSLGDCQLDANNSQCWDYSGNECDATTQAGDMCPLNMGGTSGGCQPPNLITTLINIALVPGSVDEPMYTGQAGVQTFLLLVAFICVPWLLLIKPLYLKHQHDKSEKEHQGSNNSAVANPLLDAVGDAEGAANPHEGGGGGDHGHGGEFNYGEIVIHQAIETIEFVLGMVSNTASYLRLWALSLAHSELAEVFWDKALVGMIETGNPVLIYMGYAVFAAITFAVLLCMDVLECFLHALRLHWVEFQNKFYKADGYRFMPFDFKAIIKKALLE